MARPVRMFQPDTLYFVTNRTFQGRLFMRPSETTNNIIAGVLARSAQLNDVKLFAFVFLSNHFHCIIKASPRNVSSFVQHFSGNVARKVGDSIGWHGKFWERRFSAEPILDEEALDERMRYIFAHGIKEGLVKKHSDWPGLTALPELLGQTPRSFAWPGRSTDIRTPLVIEPLPHHSELSSAARIARIKTLIKEAENQAKLGRMNNDFLGVSKVLSKHPHDFPKRLNKTPRPLCHAFCRTVREAFIASYRAFRQAYRVASEAYRAGFPGVAFPPHSHLPTRYCLGS